MILLIAKLSALLALLAVYANNIFRSDSPLFAFFYQPNFIIMLVILFIIGTFFKIIKTVFTLALIAGIGYYGYLYFTGKSPLEVYAEKTMTKEEIKDKCGEGSTWYDRLANQCYGRYMEDKIRE
jgi:hypothetical protein